MGTCLLSPLNFSFSGLRGQNINISGHIFLVMFSGLSRLSGWNVFFISGHRFSGYT